MYYAICTSPHARESGFRNPRNFCLWNPAGPECWALESGIQLKESGILLKIGNPSQSVTKTGIQYLESGIHGVESCIQVRASSQIKGLERDWGETLKIRACEARAVRARKTLTSRFTDFFTDFEKEKKTDCFAVYLTWGVHINRCLNRAFFILLYINSKPK